MAHTPAWRKFKRNQDTTVALACLIYAGAVANAFQRLPGDPTMIVRWTLVWPGVLASLALGLPLLIGALRRPLSRYVWISFQAGSGQTVTSVLVGAVLLVGAALMIYWQIAQGAAGGRYPSGIFSGYAAGIGILAAQAALTRRLERDPEVRRQIETPDSP